MSPRKEGARWRLDLIPDCVVQAKAWRPLLASVGLDELWVGLGDPVMIRWAQDPVVY